MFGYDLIKDALRRDNWIVRLARPLWHRLNIASSVGSAKKNLTATNSRIGHYLFRRLLDLILIST